mmetsp:Transcript_8180/g.14574  ORF Transcript_8180/g.14574 Transcript_8180/m.14574 type:complete len:260 (+) Transcript_8180:957-1736(+)
MDELLHHRLLFARVEVGGPTATATASVRTLAAHLLALGCGDLHRVEALILETKRELDFAKRALADAAQQNVLIDSLPGRNQFPPPRVFHRVVNAAVRERLVIQHNLGRVRDQTRKTRQPHEHFLTRCECQHQRLIVAVRQLHLHFERLDLFQLGDHQLAMLIQLLLRLPPNRCQVLPEPNPPLNRPSKRFLLDHFRASQNLHHAIQHRLARYLGQLEHLIMQLRIARVHFLRLFLNLGKQERFCILPFLAFILTYHADP